MPYPKELVHLLTGKYRLSESSSKMLTETLSVEGIRELIVNKFCYVDQMLLLPVNLYDDENMKIYTILGVGHARQLVDLCNTSGIRDLLSSGQLFANDLIVTSYDGSNPRNICSNVLNKSHARQLVAACNVPGMRDLLSSGQLSAKDLIVIGKHDGRLRPEDIRVVCKSEAQQIVANPSCLFAIRSEGLNPHQEDHDETRISPS